LVDLLHGLLKRLEGVDEVHLGLLLETSHHLGGGLVVLLNQLGQQCGGNVLRILLSLGDHSLLTSIFGALQYEGIRGHFQISKQEFGLKFVLRETLKNHSRLGGSREALKESQTHFFIFSFLETLSLHELREVNELHVGSEGQVVSNGGLARALRSDDAHELREHRCFGLFIDILDASSGVDLEDLAESLVVVHHGQGGIEVVLDPLLEDIGIVVSSTTGQGSLQASLHHDLLRHVIEKHLVHLNHILLEVLGLVEGSGESIDDVALNLKIRFRMG
jgi:hypothetical protein